MNTIFFGRVGIGFSHPTVNMLQLRISQILFRNQVALYGGPNHRRPPLLVDATDFVFHFKDGLFRLPMFVRGSSQSKRMVTWHGERNAFSESSNHVSTYRGGGLRILQRTSADWCGFAESEHGSVSANGPSTVPDGKIGPPEALMLEIVMLSEACRTELQGVGPNMAFVGPGQGWERWKAPPEGTEWREKVRALMKREDLDQVGQRGNLSTPTAR